MQEQKQGFDFNVTHRDPKTGQITHSTPYTLRVIGSGEGRQKLVERPAGSGNIFDMKNNPKGRWIVDAKTKKGKLDPNAEHIAFVPPETEDQKLARSLIEKDSRIASLEAELKAISAEKEAKSAPVAPAAKKANEKGA